jgi:hypothetical protein
MASFGIAVLIQYPPARTDWSWIGLTVFFCGFFVFSLFEWMKLSNNRIAKDTYYFVCIVLGVSLLTMLLGNIYFKLGIAFDQIAAISIVVSTPLSCLIAGYSKKTVVARLKRLGLDQGVTLFAIVLLALMPIIKYPITLWSHTITIKQTIIAPPNLVFLTTPNTTLVNGQMKGAIFLANISTAQNQTFEAERFVEINVTNWGNQSITFQFATSSFSGNFESIRELELDAISRSETKTLFFIDNEDVVECSPTTLLIEPHDNFFFSVKCLITGQTVSNSYPSISITISNQDTILKTISIVLKGS